MIQIVIWGMAIMLVVKALEIIFQECVARKAGTSALVPAAIVCGTAFVGALMLIYWADRQVNASSPAAALSALGAGASMAGSVPTQQHVIDNGDAIATQMEAEASRLEALNNAGEAGAK